MAEVQFPRICRLRYCLCLVILVLVFILIYLSNVSKRLPWELYSPGKSHRKHKSPNTVESFVQQGTYFRKNKLKKQNYKRLELPGMLGVHFRKNKTEDQRGRKLGSDRSLPREEPILQVREKTFHRAKSLGQKNQSPSTELRTTGLREKLTGSEMSLKKNQFPIRKNLNLEVQDTASRESGISGMKNEIMSLRRKALGRKKKISEKSGMSLQQNQVPFPRSPTLGHNEGMAGRPRMSLQKNQMPFAKTPLGQQNRISNSSGMPWKKVPAVEQREKMRDQAGNGYNTAQTFGNKDSTAAQKLGRPEIAMRRPQVVPPRNGQQLSLEFPYKYRASRTCVTPVDMIVVVPSSPKSYPKRQAIRDTWGSVVRTQTWPGPNPQTLPKSLGLVFLLEEEEQPGSTVSEVVRRESEKYGDVVQWKGLRQSKKSRTLKVLLGLKWLATRCPHVGHVIKVNDDTFVHVPRLLTTLLANSSATNRIWGFFPQTSPWISSSRANEVVGKDPNYLKSSQGVKGGVYVVPGEAVPRMVVEALRLPYSSMDGVYVTAMLAPKLGLRPEAFSSRQVLMPPRGQLFPTVGGDPCLFEKYKEGIFRVQMKSMTTFAHSIWNKISNPGSCAVRV